MADNTSKIVGAVIGAVIIALQGVTVKETANVSDELTELTRSQAATVDIMREIQAKQMLPELKKQTADLDQLVEQGKAQAK